MTDKPRDEWLPELREVFGGRPVRWANPIGDFDGRERTLDVFNADPRDQLALLKEFRRRALRAEVERALGGPVIVIFHTTSETARLYAEVLAPQNVLSARHVCQWCGPHFLAKLEGRSSDHTRCDDFECGCHCQDRTRVN